MDTDVILKDIFETMPSRFRSEEAEDGFRAGLGFDIDGMRWTVSVAGKSCKVSPKLIEV